MKLSDIKWVSLCWLLIGQFFLGQERREAPPVQSNIPHAKAGAFIDVNSQGYIQSTYNITDLIKKVLISGGADCETNIMNVNVSPNISAFSADRSWGYFNKGTTNFPFNEGVLLVTGKANSAGNYSQPDTLSDFTGTFGDADLANAVGVNTSDLKDATFIEFDFIPINDQISFNYIFSSEEYLINTNYPCQYTDAFALLLKKQGDANYTNLAVLPNGDAVSVTNIHPALQDCPAINEQYFGGFNTSLTTTNFNGRTVPLTATAQVIPGETYHFKMVIADSADGNFDSGVFLEAGSFNIGVHFVDEAGANLPQSINICEGSSKTITAEVNANNATYQWLLNGNAIAGATTNTYSVTQGGVYSVEVTTPNSNCVSTAEITVNTTPIPDANNTSLTMCSSESTAIFNLTSAQTNINNTNVAFSFYENEADAIAQNNNIIQNPTGYSSGNTTVYVLVKKGDCTNIAELQLIINPTPETPTITASSMNICGDETVTLTSSATQGNQWSNGETTQTITVSEGGTYTLTIADGDCVSETATITINKTENPNLQITGNNFFCTGTNTTITATADGTGNTYAWSNGATTPSITVNTGGTYTVTLTTSTGCEFQESITVTEGNSPEVQNATLSECSTQDTATFDLTSAENTISNSNGVTFTYYTNQNDAIAGNNNTIANPTAYASSTATVYVRVSIGNCFEVAELQLNHTTTPNPTITPSAPVICDGTPVTLTSNYATGNLWSTGETTQSITVTTGGTYTLTVSNGDCESETISITMEENENPNIQITGDLSICAGDSTILTATTTGTGLTYGWSTGETTQSITVNQGGTYTVAVTTSGGCVYQKSVTVTADPLVSAVIATPQEIDCNNETVVLDAGNSIVPPNTTIEWTTGNGGNIIADANTLTPTVDSAGTYTLTLTSTEGNLCTDAYTVTVIENTTPPTISLSANSLSICNGNPVILTASGGATYTWSGEGTNGNGASQTLYPTTDTTYTVTGVGTNGCQGNTATITISVVPAISSTISDIEFCRGESGILDAGSGPNYTYQWNTGENTQTISVEEEGTYNVTINNGVCSENYTATVSYTPVPVISNIEYHDNTLEIIIVPNDTMTNIEYSIDGGQTWQTSPTFVNVQPNTTYQIIVREQGENCYNETEFYAFAVPNFISPNADGFNDKIDFSKVSNNEGFSVLIYDRYGKVIFRGTPEKNTWDGKYLNHDLPTDTYWYHITWIDPTTQKVIKKEGWIMLKNRK